MRNFIILLSVYLLQSISGVRSSYSAALISFSPLYKENVKVSDEIQNFDKFSKKFKNLISQQVGADFLVDNQDREDDEDDFDMFLDIFNLPSLIFNVIVKTDDLNLDEFMENLKYLEGGMKMKIYYEKFGNDQNADAERCEVDIVKQMNEFTSDVKKVFPDSLILKEDLHKLESTNKFDMPEVLKVASMKSGAVTDNYPQFVVLDSNFNLKGNKEFLNGKIFDIAKELANVFGEKFVFNILVSVEAATKSVECLQRSIDMEFNDLIYRNLAQNDTNLTVSDSEKIEFLLLIWVNLVLIVLLIFLFCCISWETELDPILYSSFKDADAK